MALPSSPPLLPEDDANVISDLFADDAAELPTRPSELSLLDGQSRKRQYSDYGSQSSDPVFSEGGTSEAEDELGVERPRRKRLVKGPWFNLRRSSSYSLRRSMAKRERNRNADSGVWMGSDAMSEDSADSTLDSRQRMAELEMDDDAPLPTPPLTQPKRRPPTAEELAAREIDRCVENGDEAVDLSDRNLTLLSSDTLRPLQTLTRHAHHHHTRPPSEEEFTSLVPSIRLILSGNKLTSLPSELFRLYNLTVLSVRNNALTDVPPCVGRLPRLQEFSIASNGIRWLPWGMLRLMHCRTRHQIITVRPNPFVIPVPNFSGPSPLPRPNVTSGEFKEHLSRWGETSGAFFQKMKQWYSTEDAEWTMRHDLELHLKLGRLKLMNYMETTARSGVELKNCCPEQLIHVGSSAVRYFEVDGSPRRSTSAINVQDDDKLYAAVEEPFANAPLEPRKVPSLFEHSLRSLQNSFDLSDRPSEVSSSVVKAIERAAHNQYYDNEACSTCGDEFIIARAEWMEFWFNGFPSQECLSPDTVLPFLRRVCSWKCARPSELGSFRF